MNKTNARTVAVDLISEGTTVKGSIQIRSLLRIEGRVEGDICPAQEELEKTEVYIASGAFVQGNIVARRVVIEGTVAGDVKGSEAVDLFSSGRLEGGVETPHFTVQPGGVFIGESKRPKTQ